MTKNNKRAVMALNDCALQGKRRTRRALDDIVNLVPARIGVEIGKPLNRPITRNFKKLLMANAQALADNNVKIPKAEVGEAEIGKPLNRPITRNFKKVLVAKAQGLEDNNFKKPTVEVGEAVVIKNLTLATSKKFPKSVIGARSKIACGITATPNTSVTFTFLLDLLRFIILLFRNFKAQFHMFLIKKPDAEVGEAALKTRRRSKNPPKSLTSTLSARSKIACGVTARPKDPVVNVDESDSNNELAEIEYVEDIYKFYKLSETEGCLRDYMDSQPDINAKMRAIVADWIIEVHKKFDLMPEVLYLTINIVDRYLSACPVPRRELQLLSISALLISSKYEQMWSAEINDFIYISDGAYTREQILAMEKAILGRLGWYMTVPTPYVFTVRYTKASISSDNNEMGNMAFFYTELGLMDYTVIISNKPSKLAASAVYAARCTLKKTPAWTETLKHHTGYSEDQVRDCAKSLVNLHACASKSKLKAVFRKYEDPERGAVALFPPARSLVAVFGSEEA